MLTLGPTKDSVKHSREAYNMFELISDFGGIFDGIILLLVTPFILPIK